MSKKIRRNPKTGNQEFWCPIDKKWLPLKESKIPTFKQFYEAKDESASTIQDLYDYVENKEVHDIPIEKLMHELEPKEWEEGEERPGTPEFIERAKKSKLKYPIIVFKDDETLEPGELSVMDGVHRIWKAVHGKGLKTIKGHILERDEARRFKWTDDNGVEVSFLEIGPDDEEV